MIRKRCVRYGHKWSGQMGLLPMSVQFCDRIGCDGMRSNPRLEMPPEFRRVLDRVINEHSIRDRVRRAAEDA